MKFIVDANIIFSMAKQDSTTNKLILDKNLELLTPEYALDEIKKYSALIEHKYGIDFDTYFKNITTQIKIVPIKDYVDKIEIAKQKIADQKDIPYIALALKYNLPIWSNDAEFKKQTIVPVFNTKELIMLL